MTRPAPKLADFEGDWSIARHIDDHHSGQKGHFHGTARFRAVPEGLAYHEAGLLTLGQALPLTAMRDYLWRWSAGRIHVDYADGRPFHDFDPADPLAHHACDPDDYRVRYEFGGWPHWTADWSVTGPRKDYVSRSCFAPCHRRLT